MGGGIPQAGEGRKAKMKQALPAVSQNETQVDWGSRPDLA